MDKIFNKTRIPLQKSRAGNFDNLQEVGQENSKFQLEPDLSLIDWSKVMTQYKNLVEEILGEVSGQSKTLTIQTIFLEFLGSFESALLLGQLLYWQPRAKIYGGWIAKTYKDWQSEIYLSRHQSIKASNQLKRLGLIKTKIKKFSGNPTVHYQVDSNAVTVWLVQKLNERKSQIKTNDNTNFKQSLTENTSEITSEITQSTSSKDAVYLEENEVFTSKFKNELIANFLDGKEVDKKQLTQVFKLPSGAFPKTYADCLEVREAYKSLVRVAYIAPNFTNFNRIDRYLKSLSIEEIEETLEESGDWDEAVYTLENLIR